MAPPCCEVWNWSDPTAFACLAFEPPPRMPPIGRALLYCCKRIEDPHRPPSQLALHRIGIHDAGVVPCMDQLGPADDDCAMSKTPSKFEDGNIARLGWRVVATVGDL